MVSKREEYDLNSIPRDMTLGLEFIEILTLAHKVQLKQSVVHMLSPGMLDLALQKASFHYSTIIRMIFNYIEMYASQCEMKELEMILILKPNQNMLWVEIIKYLVISESAYEFPILNESQVVAIMKALKMISPCAFQSIQIKTKLDILLFLGKKILTFTKFQSRVTEWWHQDLGCKIAHIIESEKYTQLSDLEKIVKKLKQPISFNYKGINNNYVYSAAEPRYIYVCPNMSQKVQKIDVLKDNFVESSAITDENRCFKSIVNCFFTNIPKRILLKEYYLRDPHKVIYNEIPFGEIKEKLKKTEKEFHSLGLKKNRFWTINDEVYLNWLEEIVKAERIEEINTLATTFLDGCLTMNRIKWSESSYMLVDKLPSSWKPVIITRERQEYYAKCVDNPEEEIAKFKGKRLYSGRLDKKLHKSIIGRNLHFIKKLFNSSNSFSLYTGLELLHLTTKEILNHKRDPNFILPDLFYDQLTTRW